jgi:GNAT superfamily N-acetyltransferase
MSAVATAARDFSRAWREQGRKAAFAYLRGIVRAQLYLDTDEIVIRKDLPGPDPATTGGIRFEDARAEHLPMLAEFNRRQSNATRTYRFETALAEGKRALLGFRGDELIGYIWWHDARTGNACYLSRYGIALGEGDVYGDDLYIAPEHRGRGTPAAFVAGVEGELVRLGYRRMYGFVDALNMPARWLWITSGYKVVARRHTRRILRRFVLVVDGEGWTPPVRRLLRERSALIALRARSAIGFIGRRD